MEENGIRLKSFIEEAIPYSLDYWIARSSGEEIVQVLFKEGNEEKLNYVLGFLGKSEIKVGNISIPGENIGDLLIDNT